MPGNEVGPYRILRLIKRGGGGSVYVAHDRRLQRRVALKFVDLPGDGDRRRELIKESRRLAALNHRYIVQLYDVVELKDSLILVMEYVTGNDLQEILRAGAVSLGSLLQLGIELCAALDASHAAGIIHRDLKAANVLVDSEGHVKLSDFGIAVSSAGSAVSAGEAVPGSAGFAAPEQLLGAAIDERADLYSLGVLLQRLLDGLAEDNSGGVLPGELMALIARLKMEDREQRPISAAAVRQALLAIARESAVAEEGSLTGLMASLARPEDELDQHVDLPALQTKGARSLLLSSSEWRNWTGVRKHFLPGLAALAIVLLVAVLVVYLSAYRSPQRTLPVVIDRPQINGPAPASMPGIERSTQMLRQAIDEHPDLSLDAQPDATRVTLQISCNPYICGTQLGRSGNGIERTDIRAVLPGVPEAVWQQRIDQGVREIFRQEDDSSSRR